MAVCAVSKLRGGEKREGAGGAGGAEERTQRCPGRQGALAEADYCLMLSAKSSTKKLVAVFRSSVALKWMRTV